MTELLRIRLLQKFVEALRPGEVPEELREILVVPEGRNFADVEVPTETAQALRDLARKAFWSRDERKDATEIRALSAQMFHIEGELRRGVSESR